MITGRPVRRTRAGPRLTTARPRSSLPPPRRSPGVSSRSHRWPPQRAARPTAIGACESMTPSTAARVRCVAGPCSSTVRSAGPAAACANCARMFPSAAPSGHRVRSSMVSWIRLVACRVRAAFPRRVRAWWRGRSALKPIGSATGRAIRV